jgi:hypothetical protein
LTSSENAAAAGFRLRPRAPDEHQPRQAFALAGLMRLGLHGRRRSGSSVRGHGLPVVLHRDDDPSHCICPVEENSGARGPFVFRVGLLELLDKKQQLLDKPGPRYALTTRFSSRRGGRAVEGSGLENRQGESPRGFESHPLRQHRAGNLRQNRAETRSAALERASQASPASQRNGYPPPPGEVAEWLKALPC